MHELYARGGFDANLERVRGHPRRPADGDARRAPGGARRAGDVEPPRGRVLPLGRSRRRRLERGAPRSARPRPASRSCAAPTSSRAERVGRARPGSRSPTSRPSGSPKAFGSWGTCCSAAGARPRSDTIGHPSGLRRRRHQLRTDHGEHRADRHAQEDQPDEAGFHGEEHEADVLSLGVHQQEHDRIDGDCTPEDELPRDAVLARPRGGDFAHPAILEGASWRRRPRGDRRPGAEQGEAAGVARAGVSPPGRSGKGRSPGAHRGPPAGSSSPRMSRRCVCSRSPYDPSCRCPMERGLWP